MSGHHLSEAQFSDQVADIAHRLGWELAHFGAARTQKGWRTPVRYDGQGFPDLVLVHPGRGLVWFRELKAGPRPSRQLDPHQAHWAKILVGARANYDVWRPSQLTEIWSALSCGISSAVVQ